MPLSRFSVSVDETKRFNTQNSIGLTTGSDSPTNFNSNIKNKTINTKAWFTEDFPLTVSQFIPLLKILSFTSSKMTKICDFFSKL